MNVFQELQQLEPRSLHHEADVQWDTAHDWTVIDTSGKSYIDFTSGIFVANAGHGRIEVKTAILKQWDCLHSYVFPTEARLGLVKKLIEITGMEKVFLCSTGSEAVEAALRCMREPKRVKGFVGAFHGNTYGSKYVVERGLPYGCYPANDLIGKIDGIIFESYFGWNAQFHPVDWVREWCAWAKQYHIPVCFDEIQAGFGRTGKMFGYQHYDVQPDLIVVGKALSGCLPISAVIGKTELLDAPGDLSSTHTGNPVCCAAALANLEIIERERLVERAAEVGEWLQKRLIDSFPNYVIRGKGMVWAIDLKDIDFANKVVDRCAKQGLLLVKTHRGTIKIGPPLIIPYGVLQEGIEVLREITHEIAQEAL